MGASGSWPHLLAPSRIGALELRNRIVMSPMGSNLAEVDGRVGERIQRYYEERARGGALADCLFVAIEAALSGGNGGALVLFRPLVALDAGNLLLRDVDLVHQGDGLLGFAQGRAAEGEEKARGGRDESQAAASRR